MEIIVNTNPLIRKFLRIHYMSSPREPTKDLFKFADFFTPNFYRAAQISDMIYGQDRRGVESALQLSLLDRNISRDDEYSKDFKDLLESIDIQSITTSTELVEAAKNKLIEDYAKFSNAISTWIEKIFGFKLPDRLDVILDMSPWFGQGVFISDDPPLVAVSIEKYETRDIGILLHETLHYLMRRNGMSGKMQGIDPVFEETLMDYFCPYGILDEKIGILGHEMDIEGHSKQQIRLRPLSAQLSKKMLPLMEEYYRICGNETIWDFLRKKGFDL